MLFLKSNQPNKFVGGHQFLVFRTLTAYISSILFVSVLFTKLPELRKTLIFSNSFHTSNNRDEQLFKNFFITLITLSENSIKLSIAVAGLSVNQNLRCDMWKHLHHHPETILFRTKRWILLGFFTNHKSVSTIPGKEKQIPGNILLLTLYC